MGQISREQLIAELRTSMLQYEKPLVCYIDSIGSAYRDPVQGYGEIRSLPSKNLLGFLQEVADELGMALLSSKGQALPYTHVWLEPKPDGDHEAMTEEEGETYGADKDHDQG